MMSDNYGSMKPKRSTMRRFEKFMFDLAAKRKKRATHDDALLELLRKAGY